MGTRAMAAMALAAAVSAGGCAAARANSPVNVELATEGMKPLKGQQATCGADRHKSIALEATETPVNLGMGITFNAWTYNGQLPAPTIEACEGDEVTITLANHAGTAHGLDSHALKADTMNFGPVASGESMRLTRVVDTPGVYMYHCASGPVTDVHIKSGLAGAMIVYPRNETLRPARELVVVESGVYGERNASGVIAGTDPAHALKNDASLVMFNGRLEHDDLPVMAGDLVRLYFVNVGPGVSSVHVMGTLLDRVYDGARQTERVQTYGVPAGSGAIVEFRIPENGMFGLVDHDKLGFVPYGLMLGFQAAAPTHHTM